MTNYLDRYFFVFPKWDSSFEIERKFSFLLKIAYKQARNFVYISQEKLGHHSDLISVVFEGKGNCRLFSLEVLFSEKLEASTWKVSFQERRPPSIELADSHLKLPVANLVNYLQQRYEHFLCPDNPRQYKAHQGVFSNQGSYDSVTLKSDEAYAETVHRSSVLRKLVDLKVPESYDDVVEKKTTYALPFSLVLPFPVQDL